MKHNDEYCMICGLQCSGKMKIESRKGTYYSVCCTCFNKYPGKTMKEIRKLIKKRNI